MLGQRAIKGWNGNKCRRSQREGLESSFPAYVSARRQAVGTLLTYVAQQLCSRSPNQSLWFDIGLYAFSSVGLYVPSSAASKHKISNQLIIFSLHCSMVASFHKLLEYYPSWNNTQELLCSDVFHHLKKTKQPPHPPPKRKVWQITVKHSRLRFIHIIFIQNEKQWNFGTEVKHANKAKATENGYIRYFPDPNYRGDCNCFKGIWGHQMHGKKIRKLWSQNLLCKRKKEEWKENWTD